MPRRRKTSLIIRLTPAERRTLLAWQRATATISAGLARRGRIILLLADGMAIADIVAMVGMSRPHIYKWARRFLEQRVQGLADKPGRGRSQRPPNVAERRRQRLLGEPFR
jgi:hypothetical protein